MKKLIKQTGILIGIVLALAACSQPEADNQTQEEAVNETAPKVETSKTDGQNQSQTGIIASNEFFEPFEGSMDHVHGIGYAGNQNAIFFAAHDGLKVYENSQWLRTKSENHDYMGFNAVNDGFYASGHPGEESKLPNPFGIKRSIDNGKTLEALALEGEADFHGMAVGYNNHAIYALAPQDNAVMKAGEIYLSEDNAASWQKVSANGLGEKIFMFAVHPTTPDIVAAAGKDGIYLSTDKGESFELISNGVSGTSVFFNEDTLWYGGYNDNEQPSLTKYMLENGTEEQIKLPTMKEDAVMYLAQNPQDQQEIVFATFKGDVYVSNTEGTSWETLVEEGNLQ